MLYPVELQPQSKTQVVYHIAAALRKGVKSCFFTAAASRSKRAFIVRLLSERAFTFDSGARAPRHSIVALKKTGGVSPLSGISAVAVSPALKSPSDSVASIALAAAVLNASSVAAP